MAPALPFMFSIGAESPEGGVDAGSTSDATADFFGDESCPAPFGEVGVVDLDERAALSTFR